MRDNTHILGISCFYHDSAACLIRNGDILAAVQEERFARKKHDPKFPKDAIKKKLYDRLGSQENVLREFCQSQGIGFVSATAALQNMAAGGHQVYYTYDQHWTRLGHVTVAEELFRYFTASEAGKTGL